jgi:hypothetical protein
MKMILKSVKKFVVVPVFHKNGKFIRYTIEHIDVFEFIGPNNKKRFFRFHINENHRIIDEDKLFDTYELAKCYLIDIIKKDMKSIKDSITCHKKLIKDYSEFLSLDNCNFNRLKRELKMVEKKKGAKE